MTRQGAALDRRFLLRGLAGGSAVAAVSLGAISDTAEAYAPGNDEARSRYRESDHVKAFYRTNGYETKNKDAAK